MNKPRIVIRAFTRRRDVSSAALLARLLEHQGCEVLITSVRDFVRTLREWKPEIAVVNTLGHSRAVKAINPEIRTVFLDGEGFLPDEYAHWVTLTKDVSMYRAMDLVLLWGGVVSSEIKLALPKEDLSKIHVVGNPVLDLIRYMPDEVKNQRNSRSLGVVMRYPTINDHLGVPPIRTLPNPGNLERVIVQCQGYVGMINCIRELLEKTEHRISIRPHPLEQVESYQKYKAFWFGQDNDHRVDIDDTVSFCDWAVKQRAILSPTSTSLLETYLLKVPVINIDALCDTDDYNKDYAKVCEEWQAAGLVPQTMEQLVDLVNSDLPEVKRDEDIEQQLINYCNFDQHHSACLQASRYIISLARNTPKPKGVRYPTWLVDKIDELRFRRACKYNPLHPNLHYRRGYHDLPENLDAVTRNILNYSKETL